MNKNGGVVGISEQEAVQMMPVLGIPLSVATCEQVAAIVSSRIRTRSSGSLALDAINTMGISEACINAGMSRALREFDLLLPDGMPLVWVMNWKGAGLADRTYGPYLVEAILKNLPRPTNIALIGGFPALHNSLVEYSRLEFPLARFVLLYDAPPGPIDKHYVDICIEQLEASQAELVFVCLGVPRQYYWVALAKPRLGNRVCVSVGGAFDFIVGDKKYAPHWMQRTGLTWFHRTLKEPGRLARRYLRYNSLFLWLLITREMRSREFWRRGGSRRNG